jgi:hypothetical protein
MTTATSIASAKTTAVVAVKLCRAVETDLAPPGAKLFATLVPP